uniref:Peptidase C1A papain C-terminal domain-containing protein n=1 Tax=Oreochromis aureus TaxID=47969 RepID=A0A668VTI4_OREAU
LNNRKLVLIHNALADQGLKSYCLGMTQFADMENQEYKKLISQGCLGSFNDSLPRRGSTFNRLPKGTVLPKTVDWRDKGYVTKVKDQQQCGSCCAFSATGALEGQHFKKTGKLVPLSEQQLVDCSCKFRNHGCNGDLMNWAFQYIRDNGGVDTEKSYHYEAKDGQCRYRSNSIGAKCNGYVNVSPFEEALKEAVATIGPISVAIDVSHKSLQLYESGVYDEHRCSNIHLNHAVLAVGYGTENGHDYWLEKKTSTCDGHINSCGYIKMTRNKDNQCGIATAASYTLV